METKGEMWNRWLQQLFADDPDEGGDPEDGNGEEGKDEDGEDGGEPEKTFTQNEVDKLISARLAREAAKLKKEAEASAQKALEAAKKEAEKKAKMDAAEKEKYEREQIEQERDELRKYKERVELGKTVASMLSDSDITVDDDLLDLLIGEDEETTEKAVELFKKALNGAVEKKEKDRAKGTTPKATGAHKSTDPPDEIQKRIDKYKKGK